MLIEKEPCRPLLATGVDPAHRSPLWWKGSDRAYVDVAGITNSAGAAFN